MITYYVHYDTHNTDDDAKPCLSAAFCCVVFTPELLNIKPLPDGGGFSYSGLHTECVSGGIQNDTGANRYGSSICISCGW